MEREVVEHEAQPEDVTFTLTDKGVIAETKVPVEGGEDHDVEVRIGIGWSMILHMVATLNSKLMTHMADQEQRLIVPARAMPTNGNGDTQ